MAQGLDSALNTLRTPGTAADALSDALEKLTEAGEAAAALSALPTGGDVAPWKAGAERVERVAQRLSDAQARSMALVLAGAIWEGPVLKPDQAIASYQAAFRLWPRNVEALRRARALYEKAENLNLVRRLLEMELQATDEGPRRATLLVESGLAARRAGEPASVVEAWFTRALAEDPLHEQARALLGGGASPSFPARLAELQKALASTAPPLKRARILVALAKLIEEEGGGQGGDPAALLAEAAQLDPGNPDVQKLRSRVTERTGDVAALQESLETLASVAEAPEDRLDALVRLAESRLTAGDVDGADVAAERALEEAPRNERALVVLSRVAQRRGDWPGAAEALDRALESSARGAEQTALLREAAILQWRYVEDIDAAERYFRRLKLIDPKDEPTLRFYLDYYDAKGDGRKLVATLRSLLDVAPTEALELYTRIARASEDMLGDAVAAIDAWGHVLKLEPGHAEANLSLRELLRSAGRWNRLLELLKADVEGLEPGRGPQWVEVQAQIAELYEKHLNVPARAIAAWTAVLEEDPSHGPAFEALAASYRAAGRFTDLARLIETRAARSTDPGESRELLLRAARLYRDDIGNPQLSLASLWVLADRDPADLEVIELEKQCLRELADWRPLVGVFLREARATRGGTAEHAIREAADIAARHLDPAEQLEPLRMLVETTDFGDDDALARLGEALAAVGRNDERLSWLRRRAAMPHPMNARIARELLAALRDGGAPASEIGAVADQLLDASETTDDQITALYARTLASPDDRDAAEQLAELQVQSGDRAAAIETLSSLVARAEPADSVAWLQRLVDLTSAQSGSLAEAYRWAAELFEAEPSMLHFDQADDFARRAHREDDWIDVLRLVADSDGVDEGVLERAMERAAELLVARTGRSGEAIPLLERLRAARPDDEAVLRQLAAVYSAAASWGEWAEVAEQQLALEYDPAKQRELLKTLAERYERELDDGDAALGAMLRLLEAGAPAGDVLPSVERLAEQTGRWGRLVSVYEELLGSQPSHPDADGWRLRGAEVYRHRLNALEEAEELLTQVLGGSPDNEEALVELDSIRMEREDWDGLADVIEQRVRYAATPDDQAAQLHRLVTLHQHSRGDAAAAADAAARLVDAVPMDIVAREMLLELLESAGDHEELARRLASEVGLEDAGESVRDATLRLARVLVHELDRPADALPHLKSLVLADRCTEEALELIDRCAETDGPPGEEARRLRVQALRALTRVEALAAALLAAAADLVADERTALVVEAVELLDEQLGDADAALSAGLAALRDGCRSPELLDAIQAVAAQTDGWASLASALREAAEDEGDPARRLELLSRAAALSETYTDDLDEAIALRRAMANEGDDTSWPVLVSLLERAGRADELLDAADEIAAREATATGRVDVALDALRRALAVGLEPAEAATRLGLLVTDAADDAQRLQSIARLAETLDEWQVVAEALDAEAELARRTGVGPGDALVRLARVRDERLSDPRGAVDALERALSAGDTDDVLAELADLYDRLDEPVELASITERRARIAEDPMDRATLWIAAAEVYEIRLDDPDAATRAAEEAHRAMPAAPPVALHLARLYETTERWLEFAALDPYAGAAASEAAQVASIEARARVYAERLGRVSDAVELMQGLVRAGRGSWSTLASAASMAEEAGASMQARELLEAALERAGDDDEARCELLLRLAGLLREGAGDADEAAALVRAAFAANPASERAQAELERIARESDDRETLLELNEARLAAASGDARVTLLADRVELAGDDAHERSAAIAALAAVGGPVGPGAAVAAIPVLLGAGRIAEAGRLLAGVDTNASRNERHLLHHLDGRIRQAQGDVQGAIAAYRAAQAAPVVYVPNMLALANLLAEDGQWSEALNVYLAALLHQATMPTGDRVELYYRIGVARLQTGDNMRATEFFRRALSVDPGHEPSQLALEAARS